MAAQNKIRDNNGNKLVRMRSISVPRTTLEVKQYHISGPTIQRSMVNQHRLRRRDIIDNNSNSSNKTQTESNDNKSSTNPNECSSSNEYCSNSTFNIRTNTKNKNNKLFTRQKSKLIKKFQKYSKKIEDKFRKKYNRNYKPKAFDDVSVKSRSRSPSISALNKSKGGNTAATEKKAESEIKNAKITLKIADVCYDFQNHGNCKRGDSCRYKHVLASKSLCLDWKNGHCPRGDSCRFAHRYGTDIIQPKINKINHNSHGHGDPKHLRNHKKLAPIPHPQLIRNNMLLRNIPRAQFASGATLVIQSRKIVPSALPKIIASRNQLNMATRAPFAVIVRNSHTSKDINVSNISNQNLNVNVNRVRLVNNNNNMYHSLSPQNLRHLHPRSRTHAPTAHKSASLSPSYIPHYSTRRPVNIVSNDYPQTHPFTMNANHSLPITPNRNEDRNGDHTNNYNGDDDEFDFEKLGNEIQSTIQREESTQNKVKTHLYYKLAPHPPPPPPPPSTTVNNGYYSYPRYQSIYPPPPMHNNYKYKPNSSYFYHPERNNINKYMRKNHNNHVIRNRNNNSIPLPRSIPK